MLSWVQSVRFGSQGWRPARQVPVIRPGSRRCSASGFRPGPATRTDAAVSGGCASQHHRPPSGSTGSPDGMSGRPPRQNYLVGQGAIGAAINFVLNDAIAGIVYRHLAHVPLYGE